MQKPRFIIFLLLFTFFSKISFAQQVNLLGYDVSLFRDYDHLQFAPLTSAPTCNAETFGLIYMNSNYELEFCEGASGIWQQLGPNLWRLDKTNGYLYTADNNYNVGIGTSSPSFKLSLDNDGGILAQGVSGAKDFTLPTYTQGTFLFWYPYKTAFFAGSFSGTDSSVSTSSLNIGNYSINLGYDNLAPYTAGVVLGGLSNKTRYSGISNVYIVITGGRENTSNAIRSSILGGEKNRINNSSHVVTATYNTIHSGESNILGEKTDATVPYYSPRSNIWGGEGNLSVMHFNTIGVCSNCEIQCNIDGSLGCGPMASGIMGGDQNIIGQTIRVNSSGEPEQFTAGYGDFIGGGTGNQVLGTYSSIFSGIDNYIDGHYSAIGSGQDNLIVSGTKDAGAYSGFSTIIGGLNNTIGQLPAGDPDFTGVPIQYATIGGGSSNTILADYATIAGGTLNEATGTGATMAGSGDPNGIPPTPSSASGDYSFIGGGYKHNAAGQYSVIMGGKENIAEDAYSAIGGGMANKCRSSSNGHQVILGGYNNETNGDYSIALGGNGNITNASGIRSIAGGTAVTHGQEAFALFGAVADGFQSFAMGGAVTASGSNSFAFGKSYTLLPRNTQTRLNVNYSFAFGTGVELAGVPDFDNSGEYLGGDHLFGFGENIFITADRGMAIGRGLNVNTYHTFAFGTYNKVCDQTGWTTTNPCAPSEWHADDPIFVIGNGSDAAHRSNAFVVLKDGRTGIGIENPTHALHVKDAIRLPLFSGEQPTCNADAEGSIYADGDGHTVCYCNGSSWVNLIDGDPTRVCDG